LPSVFGPELSWELGQLGKLLENSQRSTSAQVKLMNMELLANQLGMENVTDVEQFRNILAEKCKLVTANTLFDNSFDVVFIHGGSNTCYYSRSF